MEILRFTRPWLANDIERMQKVERADRANRKTGLIGTDADDVAE
jgi:hypothetical protein